MPRPLRVQVAGGFFHITCRGNRQETIFRDRLDYERFLTILDDVVPRFGWRCHSYCLMPNHVHLLIETPEENLSAGMQRLNSLYAMYFNRRYDYAGHLFQGRFHSVHVQRDPHLLETARYVPLNPVRAGICAHPSDWPWSSYHAMTGQVPRPRFLTVTFMLGLFRSAGGTGPTGFVAFVDDG